eukprot:3242522-Prymnesium_polylepis.1
MPRLAASAHDFTSASPSPWRAVTSAIAASGVSMHELELLHCHAGSRARRTNAGISSDELELQLGARRADCGIRRTHMCWD